MKPECRKLAPGEFRSEDEFALESLKPTMQEPQSRGYYGGPAPVILPG